MVDLRKVTVLYSEHKLQKTIFIPATATVAIAKKIGSDEILNHLRLQPGVPSGISLNDEGTDFYPDVPDGVRIEDLNGQATMIVWPKAAAGNTLTPSPLIDALGSAFAEAENLREQHNAEVMIRQQEQPKNQPKFKPASSFTPAAEGSERRYSGILTRAIHPESTCGANKLISDAE